MLTPGGGLFVFTFSRHTLPPDTQPVPGESFVFTQFSGAPQCFLTEPQLLTELRGRVRPRWRGAVARVKIHLGDEPWRPPERP